MNAESILAFAVVLSYSPLSSSILLTTPSSPLLSRSLPASIASIASASSALSIIFGHFASPQASSQKSDSLEHLASHVATRFMSYRLASDLLYCLASYTPSAAARLCVYFFITPPAIPQGHRNWFGRPQSTFAASQPQGSPHFAGTGLVADADERAEDKRAACLRRSTMVWTNGPAKAYGDLGVIDIGAWADVNRVC
ncbi:hypothetical protein AG1IA_09671 [Rhizoctonia solani AG-1 IA]|uniref:Uncharacterized protein n=1 Tax=Thanatephorus cucumeris (strain AG1-IA) TaxID=983506 RepID=L8WEE9_THACA|nr:hypothetical protein AG1IA_09671 [Rhizoctonia solani AG-1 IA]